MFDDNSRLLLKSMLFPDNLDYTGSPVSSMVVKQVPVKMARSYISTYHYTKTMPDSTKYCFAGYYRDSIAGIIVFGMGSGKNQYTALIPTIKNGEYVELTRLWSPDDMPRNTESKLIMQSIKLLPKEIKLIISFADPSRNHVGTIYQATNFYYCGMSNGGKMLVTEDGTEKHVRLLGIYKMRHKEYANMQNEELMNTLGYKYVNSSPKHRYVMLRGTKGEKKEMYKYIQPFICEYPKLEVKKNEHKNNEQSI